jgi:hypothetical protein
MKSLLADIVTRTMMSVGFGGETGTPPQQGTRLVIIAHA